MLKFYLFIGYLIIGAQSLSQTLYLKTGINLSSLDYSINQSSLSTSTQTDFHVGAAVASEVANKLVFQFGASYSRLAIEPTSTTGFAQISAVIKYHPEKYVNFFIGPYVGLQISKSPKPVADYGVTPGLEFFLNKNIGVGVSYFYGLAEVTSNAGKVRAIQISLIYRFNSFQLRESGY